MISLHNISINWLFNGQILTDRILSVIIPLNHNLPITVDINTNNHNIDLPVIIFAVLFAFAFLRQYIIIYTMSQVMHNVLLIAEDNNSSDFDDDRQHLMCIRKCKSFQPRIDYFNLLDEDEYVK